MRIQDILSEDDTMKIKSVSGDEVTIDQGGSEIKTTTDALTLTTTDALALTTTGAL